MEKKNNTNTALFKFLVLSSIGIFMFFIPITFNGKSTIPLDHIVNAIKGNLPQVAAYYALIVIILGGLYPFIKKTWNKNTMSIIFSILKLLGIIVGLMAMFKFGPSALFEKDMIPFLYDKLVVSVGLIVPIGAIFLAFLVNYGLLEFIGVLMQPIMKPIWKTPGRSAIDAVASFVGSYSIGLLITNRVYKEGKYTAKEACIIATGFSTVSATFMIIVAKTLGLMDIWNTFFWTTLIITFVVTAITTRIRPLRKKPDKYYSENSHEDVKIEGSRIKAAFNQGLEAAGNTKSFIENITVNLKEGLVMAMGILPSILSVGLIGLLLAKYTPVFDIIGYVFYPFTYILRIPDPLLASKALSIGIAEMYLPALLVAEGVMITKFVIGVISISSILFLSASIPCILSTDIPINIGEILVIWFERTLITLIIVAPIAHILF